MLPSPARSAGGGAVNVFSSSRGWQHFCGVLYRLHGRTNTGQALRTHFSGRMIHTHISGRKQGSVERKKTRETAPKPSVVVVDYNTVER